MNYQRKILNQTLFVFIIVNLILIMLLFLKPIVGRIVIQISGAVVFILSTLIISKIEGIEIHLLGLYSDSIIKDLKYLAIILIIVFPLFFLGNHIYQIFILHHNFRIFFREGIILYLLTNLLTAAIPEEMFFRGYIQVQLSRVYNSKKIFKYISISNLLTSFFFALGHFFINPHPERLAVFFPSLLFGLLRELRGNIYPSIFLHWISNVIMYILLGMYY